MSLVCFKIGKQIVSDELDILTHGDAKLTHQTFMGWPVDFIVDADAGLARLQYVRKGAALQDQEVDGIEDFLAVNDAVG